MKQIFEFGLDTGEGTGVQRHRQNHHLHAKTRCHRQPPQVYTAFAFENFLGAARIVGVGEVADFAHRLQDAAEVNPRLVPADACAVRGIIYRNGQHAWQF